MKHLLVFVVSRGVLIALVQVAHLAMFTVNPTNILFWYILHLCTLLDKVDVSIKVLHTLDIEPLVCYYHV